MSTLVLLLSSTLKTHVWKLIKGTLFLHKLAETVHSHTYINLWTKHCSNVIKHITLIWIAVS